MSKFLPFSALLLLIFLPSVTARSVGNATNYSFFLACFLLISLILVVLGTAIKNHFLTLFSGFLLLVVGLYVFVNGLPGHSATWFTAGQADGWIYYVAFMVMGLGLFFVLRTTFKFIWGVEV